MFPKSIQLSYELFEQLRDILDCIHNNKYPESFQKDCDAARIAIYEKRGRIRNRFAFTEIVRAQTEDERAAAVQDYISTKNTKINF